jgi:hypothetical protein
MDEESQEFLRDYVEFAVEWNAIPRAVAKKCVNCGEQYFLIEDENGETWDWLLFE